MIDHINEAFGPDGYLAQGFKREGLGTYAPREAQIQFARQIYESVASEVHAVIEAPTGLGKSIGYIVGALSALISPTMDDRGKCLARKLIVVTANIALQEQLVNKDLPFLKRVMPLDFDFALAKGRDNYLCARKFSHTTLQYTDHYSVDPVTVGRLKALYAWGASTLAGDISELDFDIREPLDVNLSNLFCSSHDDCLGRACMSRQRCYAERAKTKMKVADVVVCNYHYLFSNLTFAAGTLLPKRAVVICDEGHHLPHIARSFFGLRITEGRINYACRLLDRSDRLRLETQECAKKLFHDDIPGLFRGAKDCVLRTKIPHLVSPVLEGLTAVKNEYYQKAGDHACPSTDKEREILAGIENSIKSLETLIADLNEFAELEEPSNVYFVSGLGYETPGRRPKVVLESNLVEPAVPLRQDLFDLYPSVILTSATMSVNGNLDHISSEVGLRPSPPLTRCGIEMADYDEMIAASPFNYREQVALVVADASYPAPSSKEFGACLPQTVHDIIQQVGGGVLCLFTSYRNLNAVHTWMKVHKVPYRVLRQGDMPKTRLLTEFREDMDSVLLGTMGFWEGVDVPGHSLRCVIVDKLPFTSPSDPVLLRLEELYHNSFMNYSIPKTAITLKQGFGRLIRRVDDTGVVVVLDHRLHTARYGPVLLNSLPSCTMGQNLTDVGNLLHSLHPVV